MVLEDSSVWGFAGINEVATVSASMKMFSFEFLFTWHPDRSNIWTSCPSEIAVNDKLARWRVVNSFPAVDSYWDACLVDSPNSGSYWVNTIHALAVPPARVPRNIDLLLSWVLEKICCRRRCEWNSPKLVR